jgi:type I restriction enzyme S subunit
MSFTANIDDVVAENRNYLLGKHPKWGRVRLKEVATILNGYPFESGRFKRSGGTPLIRIRDILGGSTETFYDGDFDSTFLVKRGEILIGMDGDFHCEPWTGEPALLNQRVCKITPDESRYAKQFLRYLLPGYLSAINEQTPSVTVKHLSSRTIADIPLPLPPLPEQRRIVAEIEKQFTRLEAGVAALRRVQANLKRYRAAVLKAACEGWPCVPLSDVCEVVSGYAFKSSDFCDAGIPVVKIANVSYGSYLDDSPSFLLSSFLPEFRRFQIQPGDILLALTRPITNNQVKACLYPQDLPNALLNQRVAKLAPTARILRGYLLAYLRSEHFKSAISAVMPQTLQPNLSPRDLAALPIPFPSLAEQTRIVAEVERRLSVVEELESVVTANLQRATRLRQSILQNAFTGEL